MIEEIGGKSKIKITFFFHTHNLNIMWWVDFIFLVFFLSFKMAIPSEISQNISISNVLFVFLSPDLYFDYYILCTL